MTTQTVSRRSTWPRRRGLRITRHFEPDTDPWPGRLKVSLNAGTTRLSRDGRRIFDIGFDIDSSKGMTHWNLRWWGLRERVDER